MTVAHVWILLYLLMVALVASWCQLTAWWEKKRS